jgi:hypothetical protein
MFHIIFSHCELRYFYRAAKISCRLFPTQYHLKSGVQYRVITPQAGGQETPKVNIRLADFLCYHDILTRLMFTYINGLLNPFISK